MSHNPMKILVVEDDFFLKTEILRIIKELGHQVIAECSNGRDAIEKTTELDPDAVLMDITMDVMNGIDAAKAIQNTKPTPIVFLTAHESMDMVELASEAGAASYLTKPPNGSEIDRALMVALARHSDMMELRRLNNELVEKTAALEKALEEIKTLRGIVPICSYCKKTRDDEGFWDNVETYINKHTGATLSHSICPECIPRAYRDMGLEPEDMEE